MKSIENSSQFILSYQRVTQKIIDIDYTKSVVDEIMAIGHGLNLFCVPLN